jgi:succinoglycan biosynthesis transport protein ExoP
MPEMIQEPEQESIDIERFLDAARRRYPIFLIALFLGWLVVWGASWVLPVSYKSSTQILVEAPAMPKDYVLSNINDDLQDRVQNITEQILSRTRLLQIIDRFNLYAGRGRQLTPDEKVAQMRKDITIELVHDPINLKVTAFKIEYSAPDPRIAQKVTGELTNLFINENLQVRQRQSEDTTKFLRSQVEAARQSLAEQDAKIRVFKGEHVGDLPSQQASNLQILAGMQSQFGNEQDALNTARQQQVYLQTLTEQYRTLQTSSHLSDGAAVSIPGGLPAIEKELDRLRTQLADLSSRYTDRYPDVQKVKIQIAKTEKMRDDLLADVKKRSKSSNQEGNASTARDITDASTATPLLQLQGQLQANKTEIANREHAIASLEAKVGEYQSRLNAEPIREQQLADLTRGYDQSKANYDDLLKKEKESEMATSMEEMQKGERFRMIDPPSLPLKPDFPNRLKLCAVGVGVGLALGILLAAAFEFIDGRLHTEQQIKALLPTRVISEIPQIVTPADEQRSKRVLWLRWAMTVVVGVVILAGSAFSYIHS